MKYVFGIVAVAVCVVMGVIEYRRKRHAAYLMTELIEQHRKWYESVDERWKIKTNALGESINRLRVMEDALPTPPLWVTEKPATFKRCIEFEAERLGFESKILIKMLNDEEVMLHLTYAVSFASFHDACDTKFQIKVAVMLLKELMPEYVLRLNLNEESRTVPRTTNA